MISYYKPNKGNSGALCSFKLNDGGFIQNKYREGCVFLDIVKQVSWNEEKRTGSFSKGESVTIKLNLMELGAILDCLENHRNFNAFHTFPNSENKVSVFFSEWKTGENTELVGYTFQVIKQINNVKSTFAIGFRLNEAQVLKEFIKLSIQNIIISNHAQQQKSFSEYMKNKRSNENGNGNGNSYNKQVHSEPVEADEDITYDSPSYTDEEVIDLF